jgi:hypothetical protein
MGILKTLLQSIYTRLNCILANVVLFRCVQCDRRYPCDHCTRRRRPEECTYNPSPASQAAPHTENRSHDEDISTDHETRSQGASGNYEPAGTGTSSDWSTSSNSRHAQGKYSLAELFGHVEYSGTNTLALVRKVSECLFPFSSGDEKLPYTAAPF